MSRMYGVREFQAAAARQRHELKAELQRASHLLEVHRQRRAELGRVYGQAAAEFGAALLPTLTREQVARAVALTGYARLEADDPVGKAESERVALGKRVAAIEADPRFAQRELLRHPRTGSLSRGIAECLEYRKPFEEVIELAAHERLEQLIESGYGTPDYAVGFWRVSYYSDWKAGDEILERFPGKHSFAEVRAEYLQATSSIAPLDAELARLRAEVAAGEALEREHAEKKKALSSVDSRWLGHLQQKLVSFVAECPLEAVGPRLGRVPEVGLLYKRMSAVAHKVRYLDQLSEQSIEQPRRDIAEALAKLDRDIVKYSRPKKAWTQFPGDKFEHRFRPRREAYQKRWQRFERSYTTIYAFDRYDAADFTRDFLWWDVMTDGRLDGAFVAEVVDYRRRHPHYHYERHEPKREQDWDDDAATHRAAAAEAATHELPHRLLRRQR